MTPLEIEKFASQLKPIIAIVESGKAKQQDLRERGELFNVFDAFRIKHDELAWSAFLETLLDPQGNHGCGDLFLKTFPFHPKEFDHTKVTEITLEKGIGELDKNNYESGGRIDIFVQDARGNTLIIENKIYASDQKKQQYRYWRHAKEKKDNITNFQIVYLTLNGHKPSLYSTEGKDKSLERNKEYVCMSYKVDIINWLQNCLKTEKVTDKTNVTLIINQFIETILKLNSEMEMEEETRSAIETAFKLNGDLKTRIEALSKKVDAIPEVTKQMQFLIDSYQQERIEESMKDLPIVTIEKEGFPLSYWCIKAIISKNNFNHIFFSHDVEDKAIYIGVVFNEAPDDNLIKISQLEKDPHPENKNQYIAKFGINEYDISLTKLQEIVKNILKKM